MGYMVKGYTKTYHLSCNFRYDIRTWPCDSFFYVILA